jgi:alpha-glucuronidase
MARDTHYGPGPWVSGGRPDWTALYYHRADARGIGFDRTETGSNALAQYAPAAAARFASLSPQAQKTLLWFHHLPGDWKTASGRTLWDELVIRYSRGVDEVRAMRTAWARMAPYVDAERWRETDDLLAIQAAEAKWWRDSCIAYFQTFSRRPLPPGYSPPEHPADWYETRPFPPDLYR